jgi:K+/H+ antiporter YhaU regulatory subunit KhtT
MEIIVNKDERYQLIVNAAKKRKRDDELNRDYAHAQHMNSITDSMYKTSVRFQRNTYLLNQTAETKRPVEQYMSTLPDDNDCSLDILRK